jgi:hypothetical protein
LFQKGNQVGLSAHEAAWVEEQTGYGRNSAGPNAHRPHRAISVWATFRQLTVSQPPSEEVDHTGINPERLLNVTNIFRLQDGSPIDDHETMLFQE